ncbi:MAG: murein biosynthesis integral membrane protein MurJ [Thermoclostridium sp.]|nr:murein biosynthesis integral membrane protein MurJ [Thermoclostridium sp.]
MIPGQEKKLSGTATMVMFATLLSRITGFLRNVLIKSIMSPQGYSDEFILAFTLPDLIFELLMGGAIAAAIIPVLASSLAKNKEKEGWKAMGTFMNCTIIAVIVVEIIFFIFTPAFLKLTAKGFTPDTPEHLLTLKLTRILLPSALFMILSGLLNGVLNAYHKFTAVAFGPVVYNLCVVASIFLFGGKKVEVAAWGVVISSMIYFCMQLASAFKYMKHYRPRMYIKNDTFKELLTLAIPSLAASAVVYVNQIVGGSFSTEFAENSVTMMNNANRTWQLPLGVFAQAMGVAILPTLSTYFAQDKTEEFKGVLYKGLRTVMLLCIPSTMILILMNRQIMQILFKWSEMPVYESKMYGLALMAYAPALLFQSIVVILNRAFYSIHNTRIPLMIGTSTIGLNILANSFFAKNTNLGAVGTGLSYVITDMVYLFILILVFSRKTGLNLIPENFLFLAKISLSTVAAGVVLWLSTSLIPFPWEESFTVGKKLMEIISAGAQLILPLLAFLITAILLKVDEVRLFIGSLLARLQKKQQSK